MTLLRDTARKRQVLPLNQVDPVLVAKVSDDLEASREQFREIENDLKG